MESTDCQKQLKQVSAYIRALEMRAHQSQVKGVPFSETSRLEYYDYLREQLEHACVPTNTKSIIPTQVYLPTGQKYP